MKLETKSQVMFLRSQDLPFWLSENAVLWTLCLKSLTFATGHAYWAMQFLYQSSIWMSKPIKGGNLGFDKIMIVVFIVHAKMYGNLSRLHIM